MVRPEPSRAIPPADGSGRGGVPRMPALRGVFDEVVPHLAVAERRFADRATLKGVEHAVVAGLALVARIEHVLLIAGTQAPNSWRILSELPLGTST